LEIFDDTEMTMVLAADVGGTKTLLGVFERADRRPRPIRILSYPTTGFDSFIAILDAFARDMGHPIRVDAAAAGVAGPVVAGHAHLTNITWNISEEEMAAHLGIGRARLVNDLEALANSAEALADEEVAMLQDGTLRADGNAVVIAAGTGLGQAYLHRVGDRLRPVPSEGGHADFASRTDREIELMRMLRGIYGRAEVEHVLSGPGLLNLHRFTHGDETCGAVSDLTPDAGPAAISQAAMASRCPACVEALAIFVSVYGAEAGNLALRGMATSGVYVGGGMAPKILPLLRDGRFLDAFRDKGTMAPLVAQMPVKVILNPEAGLVGAAIFAQQMLNQT
jgi:glucokinase